MSVTQTTSAPKSRKLDKESGVSDRYNSTVGALSKRAAAPVSDSRLGAFYSAGPVLSLGVPVQAKLSVGQAGDPFEREADTVADRVIFDQVAPPISVLPPGGPPDAGQAAEGVESSEEEPVQLAWRNGAGKPAVSPATKAILHSPGLGQPIPAGVRRRIEPHVGADLGGVRVHTGPDASRVAGGLRARALTHGPHIFLNDAESSRDVRLMAHEATHVVQQRAAPPRGRPAVSATPHEIQRLELLGFEIDLADVAEYIGVDIRSLPGYRLFTVIIGEDPFSGDDVERNADNLLGGLLDLVDPYGTIIFDQLKEYEVLQDAFDWIVQSMLGTLDLWDSVIETLEDAWDEMSILSDPADNLRILERHLDDLLDEVVEFAESLVSGLIDLIKGAAVGVVEGLLEGSAVWALVKKLLGYDPLRGEVVEATGEEIIRDFFTLIGQEHYLEQVSEETMKEAAAWLDVMRTTFLSLLVELGLLFDVAWEVIQPENLLDLPTNLENLAAEALGLLQRVWDFATTVVATVLAFVKKSLLARLSEQAHKVPGFYLITVILGQDPFTEEEVPRTAENIIKGFITLLPNGEQQYEELARTGAIDRTAKRIEGALADLEITWEYILGLFTDIWNGLSFEDLLDPLGAFGRVIATFEEPISRLIAFVYVVVKEIFKLLLEMMHFPSGVLSNIVNNVMRAYEDVKKDPVGFLENLLAAVKWGFGKFFDNFVRHLVNGIEDWLFGRLREAGIEPPKEITLESVLGLVLQVLGIDEEYLWDKLAQHIGQENVDRIRGAIDRLEGIWRFVRDVQERGVVAIWEHIESQISDLWDVLLEKIQDWMLERIITRVSVKLLSMLDPTGIMAVINSFIFFFNAVESAIEYMREMFEIVDSFTSTVAEIAQGNISRAARFLEDTLAQSLPVAIGFLANQVGLDDLGAKVQEIITEIREVIDKAVDWLLERAVSTGKKLLGALGVGREKEAIVDPKDHETMAKRAVDELETPIESAKSYDALRSAKEKQARQIEERYSAVLEPGIGLSVKFQDAATDRTDNSIDFQVIIAPNTTTKSGKVPISGNLRFKSNIAKFDFDPANDVLTVEHKKKKHEFRINDEIHNLKNSRLTKQNPYKITGFRLLSLSDDNTSSVLMIDYYSEDYNDKKSVSAISYMREWRKPITGVFLTKKTLLAENDKGEWKNRDTARSVLNYRYHGVQINPKGKEWEHIAEHSTGGPNSVDNLGLIDKKINGYLNMYYKKIRRGGYTHKGKILWTKDNPMSLREYMKRFSESNIEFQKEVKERIYKKYNISVQQRSNERGRYQVIE
jgi:hypothetical protein